MTAGMASTFADAPPTSPRLPKGEVVHTHAFLVHTWRTRGKEEKEREGVVSQSENPTLEIPLRLSFPMFSSFPVLLFAQSAGQNALFPQKGEFGARQSMLIGHFWSNFIQ